MKDPLEQYVVCALRPCLGAVLDSVVFHCFEGEVGEPLPDGDRFEFGGEVEFRFRGGARFFVCWDGRSGWPGTFALDIHPRTHFASCDALERHPPFIRGPWHSMIGLPLQSATVYGNDGVPAVVELDFGAQPLVVGTSSSGQFVVDVDEIAVAWGPFDPRPGDFEQMWPGGGPAT